MASERPAPTGLSRRRQRISDEETERRMLQAAVRTVKSTGLTVSLEHISLEDVIRDAGVSRSAVYRRWPYKDLFFSDLLKQLARDAIPAPIAEPEAGTLVDGLALEGPDQLADPSRRGQFVVELIRQGSLRDFQILQGSAEWRTYIALHATFLSLPDGDLRQAMHDALAEAERTVIGQIAARTRHLASLLGYRIRPGSGGTFETIASLVSAMMRGMVVMAPVTPALTDERISARPFGTENAEWSQPALGTASIVFGFLEPDPQIEWDEERIATVRAALAVGAE